MHPFRTLAAALFATATLMAQQPPPAKDPLVAGKARLQKALQTMLQLERCAFTSKWGPEEDPAKQDGGQAGQAFLIANSAMQGPGEATGSWGKGLLHCAFGDDEVVLANRRLLARGKDGAWVLRRSKHADGSPLGFVPDPQLLLQWLAQWDLAVVHQETSSLDDRPVEILTVTLNGDQAAEAIWSGLLPEGGGPFAGFRGQIAVRLVQAAPGGAAAARPALPRPEATIDLAISLDPATGLVHRIDVRTWQKDELPAGMIAGRARLVVNGRAVGGDDGDDEDSEEEQKKAEAAAKAPLVYKDGLPQRPRKKMAVDAFGITFREHGKAALPALDDKAKGLLGVQ